MTDFSTYKFRCSGLKNLLVTSRSKIDPLSETTKTYLRDIFIKETYGRQRPEIQSSACLKGTMVESDSLDLVQKVTGKTYFKNNNHLENEWIKGTPDVISDEDAVKDIKSSYNIYTFSSVDEKKAKADYFPQILGYMWLTGKTKGELNYCLVNTPEQIIDREMYRASFANIDILNAVPEAVAEFRKNYIFDDIPAEARFKSFQFEFDPDLTKTLVEKIQMAREYLKGLSL